jgi:hypothetical protein
MKSSRILIILFALVLFLVTPGCKKFLQKDPQGLLTEDQFPTSASDALLATNAAYAQVRDWYYNSGGYPILDIMSDDARKGSNPSDQASTVGPYDYFGITPTSDGLDRWWTSLYVGVRRANVIIEKVPPISMDETLKSRYIGEAKFLRALFYFDFVRAWGGVPLVTTTDPPLGLARADTNQVYALILSDLQSAINSLPESYQQSSDVGRATKWAAEALLARVSLFRHNFVDAETYAMNVINSGKYSLEPVYINANGINGNNGVESVFEVGALEVENQDAGGDQYGNTQGVRGTPNKGWGFNRPSMDFRHSFEAGDPRYKGTVINLNDTIDGIVILGDAQTPDVTLDTKGDTIEVECYSRKVWVPGSTTTSNWGLHRRLIRYADVLLMAAEALNENGKPTEALTYLNMVRARARQGNPNILPDITTTDQSQLRDIIFNERRHELGLEGFRFWDLVRTGRAPAILGPLGFVTGKNEVLPIPQSEIDLSQGSLVQNPNY